MEEEIQLEENEDQWSSRRCERGDGRFMEGEATRTTTGVFELRHLES